MILVTSYYEIKNYIIKKRNKNCINKNFKTPNSYIKRFSNLIDYFIKINLHATITFFYIYVNDHIIKQNIESILHKYNKLLKYKVIIKDICPKALKISKYIADDCGRKSGKSLSNGIAKKLIQVWCNKVLLLRYTYQTYKHQDKYTWIDFGIPIPYIKKKKLKKINLNNVLLDKNYIYIKPCRGPKNFGGKCPISAQFIANLFMVDYKFLLEFTELFLKSFDEFSIYTQYFDEEIIIQYMYLMNYIKIIN